MKKFFILTTFLALPIFVFAQGIIPCQTGCGFNDLIALVNNLITLLIQLGTLVAAIMFAYAGWLYVTSGGSPSAVSKAKDIFFSVAIGFFFMLAGWLIVSLILKSLGFTEIPALDFINNLLR